MILLIDNYDSFTYNLYQYICELGYKCKVKRNNEITIAQIKKSPPDAIVISPGPGRPEEAGICLEVIKELSSQIPILGICLGHQCIGQAFGGDVVSAPTLMHGKTSEIFHKNKTPFKNMSNPFKATRYHSLVVDRKTLPNCFIVTGESEDGTIMAMRHKTLPLHGIQFHPESIMTDGGHEMLRQFFSLKSQKKGKMKS